MREVHLKLLSEIAQIERAKKGKTYPSGCSLVALSAVKESNVGYLEEAGEVDTRYAVIIPNTDVVLGKYLHHAICYFFPEFLHRHRTGINLQFDELQFLKLALHDLAVQQEFVNELEQIDRRIAQENEIVAKITDMKESMLDRMFPE